MDSVHTSETINGHTIQKHANGHEFWYDENDHVIYHKSPTGYRIRCDYDQSGNLIHLQDSRGKDIHYSQHGQVLNKKQGSHDHQLSLNLV